jgi:hypothetical protein
MEVQVTPPSQVGCWRHEVRHELVNQIISHYGSLVHPENPALRGTKGDTDGRRVIERYCNIVLFQYPGSVSVDGELASSADGHRVSPERAVFERAAFLAYALLKHCVFSSLKEKQNIRAALDAGWLLFYAEGGAAMATREPATDEIVEALYKSMFVEVNGSRRPSERTWRPELVEYYAMHGICQEHQKASLNCGKRCHQKNDVEPGRCSEIKGEK